MVKGALESLTGENLFGGAGSSWSVVYSDIDAHNRNRTVFDTILPRESNSKVERTLWVFKMKDGVLRYEGLHLEVPLDLII